MKRTHIAALATLAVTMTGCTGTSPSGPSSPPTQSTTPPVVATKPPTAHPTNAGVTYRFASDDGILGSFTIPSPQTSMTRRIEKVRKEAGGKPLTYVVVNIDNRLGTEPANMYKLVLVDDQGNQTESVQADDVLTEWEDLDHYDTYNKVVALQNDINVFYRPGSKGQAVVLFTQPIKTVSRAYVYPSGGIDDTEAWKD